jgi:hypothetical protein
MKITTLEEAFEAVQKNGWHLYYVPEDLRTPELCKITVEQYGGNLKYVPEARRTPELCKLAVENNGDALYHVPKALRTPELCKLSVVNHGLALRFVPNPKSFFIMYPEFLPQYFKETRKKDQDSDIISLLIQTTNNKVIDEIGNKINLYKIRKKDLPFLIGCKNPTITDFLNANFKASK